MKSIFTILWYTSCVVVWSSRFCFPYRVTHIPHQRTGVQLEMFSLTSTGYESDLLYNLCDHLNILLYIHSILNDMPEYPWNQWTVSQEKNPDFLYAHSCAHVMFARAGVTHVRIIYFLSFIPLLACLHVGSSDSDCDAWHIMVLQYFSASNSYCATVERVQAVHYSTMLCFASCTLNFIVYF